MTGRMVERLNGTEYFAAATELLAEYGSDGLTIVALCGRLGVTKGSFYHHFESMPGFVSRLLAWVRHENHELVRLFEREQDLPRQLDLAIGTALRLDHAAEAALRAWGRSNREVAETISAVDHERQRYLERAFVAAGTPTEEAVVLARMTVDILVGRQQRERPVDLANLATVFGRIRDMALAAAQERAVAPAN